jgi:hypothetical protein
MSFRQFQYSEGGKASKVAVIGAAVIGSGRANIHEHVDDIHGACCADVKRKYRQHALKHHSDKHGCPENFYKLTNAKEQALKTCNPCSHNRDKKPRGRKQNPKKTKYRKGSTKKKAKAKRRKEKSKKRQQEQQRNKDNHETKVSATSVAMVVGGLVLASRGPGKKKKKKLLRQTSIGRQTT